MYKLESMKKPASGAIASGKRRELVCRILFAGYACYRLCSCIARKGLTQRQLESAILRPVFSLLEHCSQTSSEPYCFIAAGNAPPAEIGLIEGDIPKSLESGAWRLGFHRMAKGVKIISVRPSSEVRFSSQRSKPSSFLRLLAGLPAKMVQTRGQANDNARFSRMVPQCRVVRALTTSQDGSCLNIHTAPQSIQV